MSVYFLLIALNLPPCVLVSLLAFVLVVVVVVVVVVVFEIGKTFEKRLIVLIALIVDSIDDTSIFRSLCVTPIFLEHLILPF